jgi:hypothetical protein
LGRRGGKLALAAPLLSTCGGGKPSSTPSLRPTTTAAATTTCGSYDDHDGQHDLDDQGSVAQCHAVRRGYDGVLNRCSPMGRTNWLAGRPAGTWTPSVALTGFEQA